MAITRATMDSMRRTALVADILYLITFVRSIPAVFLLNPVLSDPSYIGTMFGVNQPGSA